MIKENNKKIALLIFFVVVSTIVIARLTYAFFEAQASNANISGDSCFDINYTKGQDVDGDLEPGTSKESGFYTDVQIGMIESCETIGKGTLYLTTKSSSTMDFSDNALRYSVVVGNNVVSSGAVTGEENQVIYDNFNVSATGGTYRVYIWLDSSLERDSFEDETYEGYVHASVVATSGIKS